MAFINEEVPEQDIEKYGLREINKKFLIAETYQWTVDRERDIYLRWIRCNREEPSEQKFSFYWKGILLEIHLKMRGDGVRGGKGSTTWTWLGLGQTGESEKQFLKEHAKEIVADLKDALRTYKSFGLYTSIADHTAYFEF